MVKSSGFGCVVKGDDSVRYSTFYKVCGIKRWSRTYLGLTVKDRGGPYFRLVDPFGNLFKGQPWYEHGLYREVSTEYDRNEAQRSIPFLALASRSVWHTGESPARGPEDGTEFMARKLDENGIDCIDWTRSFQDRICLQPGTSRPWWSVTGVIYEACDLPHRR